jgi:hypothetical protein
MICQKHMKNCMPIHTHTRPLQMTVLDIDEPEEKGVTLSEKQVRGVFDNKG